MVQTVTRLALQVHTRVFCRKPLLSRLYIQDSAVLKFDRSQQVLDKLEQIRR